MKILSAGFVAGLGGINATCKKVINEEFLQKHFPEMTDEEKKRVVQRLEEKYLKQYGKSTSISSGRPNRTHSGAMALIYPGALGAGDAYTRV